ncbi:heparan sulfate glucosamine 3-O-sulfotransferase 5-like [Lytechinus pictus]|uniref:heparan sulfate glucosamine 3-O-sulfotransferase 5-like n=1 Tax=Lytechinus pictus TaxID=7653 RepID=UPI0030B9ECAF
MATNTGPLRSYLSGLIFGTVVFGMCYSISSYAAYFIERSASSVASGNLKRNAWYDGHLGSQHDRNNSAGVQEHFPQKDVTMMRCPQELDSTIGPGILAKLDCRKRLPQVIGIGVEKCGTGAMAFFLTSHPSIAHSTPQEIYFWNKNKDKDLEWYRDQMPVSTKYQVTIEKTPSYIFEKDAPERIKASMPDTKFMLLIRDPIVRAVSDYLHLQNLGLPELFSPRIVPLGYDPLSYCNTTFEGSVIKPNGEVNTDNGILAHSAYVLYLRRWMKLFPRDQFLIIDGDEFAKNPLPGLKQVESFLGIPHYFNEKLIYFDEQKGFFCKAMVHGRGTICAGATKGRPHPTVDDDVIRKLRSYFRPYNTQLEDLLGQRFSWS